MVSREGLVGVQQSQVDGMMIFHYSICLGLTMGNIFYDVSFSLDWSL
jgi:hypothetical protein